MRWVTPLLPNEPQTCRSRLARHRQLGPARRRRDPVAPCAVAATRDHAARSRLEQPLRPGGPAARLPRRPAARPPGRRAAAPAARAPARKRRTAPPALRRHPSPAQRLSALRPRRTSPRRLPHAAHLQRARQPPAARRGRSSPAVAALRGLQSEVYARGPCEGQQHFGDVELGRRHAGGALRQQHREREQQLRQPRGKRRHPPLASPPATQLSTCSPSRRPSPPARSASR